MTDEQEDKYMKQMTRLTPDEKKQQILQWAGEGKLLRLGVIGLGPACYSVPSEAFVLGISPRLVNETMIEHTRAAERDIKLMTGLTPKERDRQTVKQEIYVLQRAMTATQVAKLLNLSRQSVNQRIKQGKIIAVLIGKVYVIPASEVNRIAEGD